MYSLSIRGFGKVKMLARVSLIVLTTKIAGRSPLFCLCSEVRIKNKESGTYQDIFLNEMCARYEEFK